MIEVFFSYSHTDEELRDQLEKHLAPLKREGIVQAWHDRQIIPGAPLDDSVARYLESADIILLLVSSDFAASEYCYSREMMRALARHKAGDARVIPVILRHCDWQNLPFGHLLAVPKDGKPIVSWPDRDEAFTDVAKAIRRVAKDMDGRTKQHQPTDASAATSQRSEMSKGLDGGDRPRSSNLRVKKTFTDQERDRFKAEALGYIATFFETSLHELSERNPEIGTDFQMVNPDRFQAAAYRHGHRANEITVWLSRSGSWGREIVYVQGRVEGDSTTNGGFSVDDDGHALYLKADVFSVFRSRDDDRHLTFNGAAELLWEIFVEPLQR